MEEPDQIRHCYIRATVLKQLAVDDKVLNALMEYLGVPGTAAARQALPPSQKLDLIERQIEHHRGMHTSCWYNVPAPEIFAASLWRCEKVPGKTRIFSRVKKGNDLKPPVALWLKKQKFEAVSEVPMGTKRADVVGFKKDWWNGTSVVTVELKNDIKDLERGLDQMTTYADYSHMVYLACTPALAAEYLARHASAVKVQRWEGDVLMRKLKHFKLGLLLVEKENVYKVQEPVEREPAANRLEQVMKAIVALRQI